MLGGTRSSDDPSGSEKLSAEDRDRLRKALALVQGEFSKAISSLKRLMYWITILVIISIAIAISGGVLLQITPFGGLISVASVGTLAALLIKMWNLARSQAMLEILPSRYELAISFCQTKKDVQELIAQFLSETTSIRSE